MPPTKYDVVLFALQKEGGGPQQLTTCADLEHIELSPSQGGQETCTILQQHYNQLCCSTESLNQESLPIMKNVNKASAYLRGIRALSWIASGSNGVSSQVGTTTERRRYSRYSSYNASPSTTVQTLGSGSSQYCSDNRYTSNDVRFATPGGACMCPVCADNRSPEYLNQYVGATFYVPGGETYTNKNCVEMNSIGMSRNWLINCFCALLVAKTMAEC